jgi:protein-tyrosine phosphatase
LEDQTLLADEYHLGTVIDFRTELEYARRPDVEMKGVDYVSLPVWGGNALWENREITLEYVLKHVQKNPESFMMNMYQKLILDKECQHQYALFFQCLMDCEEGKAVLWHSSFGKDRAAIASMLLLYALEVPRGEIFDDYMLSNRALEKDQKYLERLLKSRGEDWEKVERLLVLMSAQECYLQTAMNTIQAEYGSMERYLRKAVCLTARSLKILRGKYLV